MRCPKCQYVGFEPSPRCKNCGYDFSLGSDEAPALTLVTEPEYEGPMADFELQIFDDVAVQKVQAGAMPFDLDELLANGRAGGDAQRETVREPVREPLREAVREPAFRRKSSAPAALSASAVATPPPMELEIAFKPEAVAQPIPAPPPAPAPAPKLSIEFAEPEAPAPLAPAPLAPAHPAPAGPAAPAKPAAPPTTELPLFMQGMNEVSAPAVSPAPEIDDRPLVQVPAVPRQPLAVRRATPDPARLRAKYARAQPKAKLETSGDLLIGADASESAADPAPSVPSAHRLSAEPTPTSLPAEWMPGVSPAKRLMAAALDSALLVAIDATVIWFALSVLGLAPGQANLLPAVPILLFFLLLDAGYLVLFTAACGQTLGKMAAGIRVVGTTTGAVINDRITLGQAVMRSLGSIVSMVPLGAGFWFALVGDRRAIHDRLARTRVVSA